MARNTSTLLFSSLLHLCAAYLVLIKSQLLPIVDDKGGNAPLMQTHIIHVEEPEGGTKLLGEEDLKNWHKSFLPNATLDSGEPRLVYSYRHAISGFAARLNAEEVSAMKSMHGFLYAHPDQELVGVTTYTTSDFLGLGQSNSLWQTTNAGEGIIIGMIDSGITPGHPSFLDDGTLPAPPTTKWGGQCHLSPYPCTNKLIGAVGFLAGSSASPIDQHGHGTHTASTAAGSPVNNAEVLGNARGTAIGAAPRAHLAIYRVLDQDNRGSDSDFLKGIDQAIADGVDVLSMSLGSNQPTPLYMSSIAVASFSAIIQGIFPSAAAGNQGPTASTLSNDAPWLLTVGASSSDRRITTTVKLGDGTELDGESAYQPTPTTSQLPLIYPGIIFNTQEAYVCAESVIDQLDVNNKIVLCVAGVISNVAKGAYIRAAGGAGMIVMNPQDQGFTTSAEPHVLPASHVSNRDAQKIVRYLQTSTNPTAQIISKGTQFGARPSPTVAYFSSRGPSLMNGGILKPDILGPGVNVLAAWPFQVGPTPTGRPNFNFVSGTSMATPHLSGIAAMIKKNHSNWSPAAIKSAIMTTAHALDIDGNSIQDDATNSPAIPFAKGIGLVDPARAMDPGLVYDLQPVDYVPYLCGIYNDVRMVQAIVRQRVDCSNYQPIGAENLNYPSIALTLRPGEVKYIRRTLMNVGTDAIYSLQINLPAPAVGVSASTQRLQFSRLYEQQSFQLVFTNGSPTSQGQVYEGYLTWTSTNHIVRSLIIVTVL